MSIVLFILTIVLCIQNRRSHVSRHANNRGERRRYKNKIAISSIFCHLPHEVPHTMLQTGLLQGQDVHESTEASLVRTSVTLTWKASRQHT